MFTDQISFMLLFKALTLAILLVIVLYGYKVYLKPVLTQMLDDMKGSIDYLIKTRNALDEQQSDINKRDHSQQQLAENLSDKIKVWRTVVDRQNQNHAQETRLIQQSLLKTYAQQQQKSMLDRFHKQAGKRALAQAYHELEQKFADPHQATMYMQALTKAMKDL